MISLAHNFYIDELLWFVVPVGIALWVLRVAERKARERREAEEAAESADTGSTETESPSD
ncbi:MAG: hypothetical protein R3246_09580 [Acidimicrobiia bacterium]|nr:hypothetical protein [Acidimicrobiia bacterium]